MNHQQLLILKLDGVVEGVVVVEKALRKFAAALEVLLAGRSLMLVVFVGQREGLQ